MTMLHRSSKAGKRELRRALTLTSAAEQIGKLTPGIELFGVSKSFSLIDALTHLLQQTGPAHVWLSTWSAANADLTHALKLLTNGSILSFRLVTDFSFQSRQPSYCAALREKFGDASLRVSKNHSKYALIRNGTWNIVLLTSANLNENLRLESYQVSDDKQMADYLEAIIADLFEFQAPGEGFSKKPGELCRDFARFGEPDAQVDEATIMQSTDAKKYFGTGLYDRDISRSGISYGGKP